MRKHLFTAFILLFAGSRLSAQTTITLDGEGRVSKIEQNRASSGLVLNAAQLDESLKVVQANLKKMLLEKLSATIRNLTDIDQQQYHEYYRLLWTNPANGGIGDIVKELQDIRTWVTDTSKTAPKITYLKPFFNLVQALVKPAKKEDWYLIDGKSFTQTPARANDPVQSVPGVMLLKLQLLNKFNEAYIKLFTDTYTGKLSALTPATYGAWANALQAMQKSARTYAVGVNQLTPAIYDSLEVFKTQMEGNGIIVALRDNAFSQNWIWLRHGDVVINPLERRARDNKSTAGDASQPLPRNKNIDLTDSLTIRGEVLNEIRFFKHGTYEDHMREVNIYRISPADASQIEGPVRGDDKLRIVVHNIAKEEKVQLRLTGSTGHDGLNETMTGLKTTFDSLGDAITGLSEKTAWIGALRELLKSANDIETPSTLEGLVAGKSRKKAELLKQLSDDFRKKGHLNENLFNLVAKSLSRYENGENITDAHAYVDAFIQAYKTKYGEYEDRYAKFLEDTIVVSFTYAAVYENNLPFAGISMQTDITGPARYRSQVFTAGPINQDKTNNYEVRAFTPKADKEDSTSIMVFSVKTGRLRHTMISAGFLYTFAHSKYGINTFKDGTATSASSITTKRPVASYTVGLHIYPWKFNTLDNHWLGSTDCPWYSRLSGYIGFDLPNLTQHFYTGGAYDIIPGLKLMFGEHLYVHNRYNIRNDRAVNEGKVLKGAGPYIGLSIDPSVVKTIIAAFK